MHLKAVEGQGMRGRGSDLPLLMTGNLGAVSLYHTGWDLYRREEEKEEEVRIMQKKNQNPSIKMKHGPFIGGSLKLWERDGRAVKASVRMSAGEMTGARSHDGSWD